LGDVSSQLFGAYGGDTVAYPGHGDDTTLGEEASAAGGLALAGLAET
jgi:hypothetical protein